MLEELGEGCGEFLGGGLGIFTQADEHRDCGGMFEALEGELEGEWVPLGCQPLVHIWGEGF